MSTAAMLPPSASDAAASAPVTKPPAAAQLTPAQREAFLAPRFQRGHIPEAPPPDDMC